MTTTLRCPHCGGEVQATAVREVYFHLEDGAWVLSFCDGDEAISETYYCENDCHLNPDAVELPPLPTQFQLDPREEPRTPIQPTTSGPTEIRRRRAIH